MSDEVVVAILFMLGNIWQHHLLVVVMQISLDSPESFLIVCFVLADDAQQFKELFLIFCRENNALRDHFHGRNQLLVNLAVLECMELLHLVTLVLTEHPKA